MSGSARFSALSRPAQGDPTRPVLEMSFRGHRRDICCAAFQPSASPAGLPTGDESSAPRSAGTATPPRLLTGGADGAVMLWDPRPTNRALRFVGHRGPVLGCDYCPLSVAGASVTLLASCGMDGYARLWVPNLRHTSLTHPSSFLTQQQRGKAGSGVDENGASWRVHTGAARAIKFAQDGSSHVYTAGDDKSVKAWDLNYVANGSHYPSGEPIVTFRGSRFLGNFNSTAPSSRSGRGSGSGGSATATATTGAAAFKHSSSSTHTNWVRCLAVQRSGGGASFSHHVASGGDDNCVMVWDTRSPHAGPAHVFYEHRAAVRGVSFHDNGYHIASCDVNGVINLFDMRRSSSASPSPSQRQQRYGLLQHYADAHGAGGVAVNEVAFAPSYDGASSWLLSAGDDGTAKLWDTVEGFLYCIVQAHAGPVRTVGFATDGGFFATGGADGVAMVWRSALTAQDDVRRQPPRDRPEPATAPTPISVAPAHARQNYTYDGADAEEEAVDADGAAHPVRADEKEPAPPPPSRVPAYGKPRGSTGVDPSYLDWQRRHNLLGESGAARKRHADPCPTAPSTQPQSGDSQKPASAPATGRPPLPPPTTSHSSSSGGPRAAAVGGHGREKQVSSRPAEAGAAQEDEQDARERSFERSEERYSHISTPQKEHAVREARRQHAPSSTTAAGESDGRHTRQAHPTSTAADSAQVRCDIAEQEAVARREKQIALSELRLENVESAVASLVEYVQEENAHRDRELARLQEAVEGQHAKQREEVVTLKGMMEQLLAQQSMLLSRITVATHTAKPQSTPAAPPPPAQAEEEPPADSS